MCWGHSSKPKGVKLQGRSTAKTVGHAHGLQEASRIVLEKTGDEALARLLHDGALAKQEEADRQLAALLSDGCT